MGFNINEAIVALKSGIPFSYDAVAKLLVQQCESKEAETVCNLTNTFRRLPVSEKDVISLIDLLRDCIYDRNRFLDENINHLTENRYKLLFWLIIEKLAQSTTPWSKETFCYLLKQNKELVKCAFSSPPECINEQLNNMLAAPSITAGVSIGVICSFVQSEGDFERAFNLFYKLLKNNCPFVESQASLSFLKRVPYNNVEWFYSAWKKHRGFVIKGLQLGANENIFELTHLTYIVNEKMYKNEPVFEKIKGKYPSHSKEIVSLREFFEIQSDLPF